MAIGLAPDGAPLAFNAGHYSDSGRGEAHIREVKDFCSAADGFLYVLTEAAVRRIDPRSGEVTTWLH